VLSVDVGSMYGNELSVEGAQFGSFAEAAPPGPAGPEPSPPLRRILFIVDAVALALGWLVVETLFARGAGDASSPATNVVIFTLMGTGFGLFLMSASGLYRRRICQVRSVELARIARVAALLAVLASLRSTGFGTPTALAAGLGGGGAWLALISIERGFLREWIAGRRASGDYRAPVIVVGAGIEAVQTATFLRDHPVLGYDVRGIAGPDAQERSGLPWFGDAAAARPAALRVGATGVVVDGGSLTGNQLNEAVRSLSAANLHVHVTSGLRGVDWRRVTVSPLADETVLHIAPARLTRRQEIAKRGLDVVTAGLMLVLGGPVLALVAAAICVGDRGPVLFRQTRVGQDGELFTVYKFRTMVTDAEARLGELAGRNARNGPLFKMSHDPRVTRVGRFLRATSLDEVPQLLNVLEGTMSMVGPRPALPSEVAEFDEELAGRTRVKPGVTGLWQVEARDLASFDLYRRFDLLYVENWSVSLDAAIIARTATATLLRGVRALLPHRRITVEGRAGVLD
jgi:exopolysaccharide biosynthesis polyprenyl glycosylphosphotransferase